MRSADIEVPRTFFSPASWGLWAAVVSAADPSAIGSRVAPGWVAESWRRTLREHLITLDPKVSLRSLEASEELLLARFIDIASTTVDGFLSFRGAGDVCGRLVPSCAEGTKELHALARPLVRRLASSKDPFDKEVWRRTKRSLFGTAEKESDSDSDSDADRASVHLSTASVPGAGAAPRQPPAGSKKKTRRARRAILKRSKQAAEADGSGAAPRAPSFNDFRQGPDGGSANKGLPAPQEVSLRSSIELLLCTTRSRLDSK